MSRNWSWTMICEVNISHPLALGAKLATSRIWAMSALLSTELSVRILCRWYSLPVRPLRKLRFWRIGCIGLIVLARLALPPITYLSRAISGIVEASFCSPSGSRSCSCNPIKEKWLRVNPFPANSILIRGRWVMKPFIPTPFVLSCGPGFKPPRINPSYRVLISIAIEVISSVEADWIRTRKPSYLWVVVTISVEVGLCCCVEFAPCVEVGCQDFGVVIAKSPRVVLGLP